MAHILFFRRSAFLAVASALVSVQSLSAFTLSGTVYTTNGSQADVQAALNAASPGNTVKIPAGTFDWGAGFTAVNVNSAVYLIGAGQGSTIIDIDPTAPNTVYGTIQIFAAAVVGNFTINAPPPVNNVQNNAIPFAVGGTSGWRITNVTYDATDGGQAADQGYFCFVSGSYGLIDTCTITGGGGTDELIFTRGPTNSWQTPDSPGTANAVYVENCTFNGQGYVSDFNSNSRAVVRYCTVNGSGMKIDGHGFATNSPARSFREIEAYRNTFTSGSNAIELRGGTGFVFDNQAVNQTPANVWMFLDDYGDTGPNPNYGVAISNVSITGNPTTITTSSPHGFLSNWGPITVQWNNAVPTSLLNTAQTVTVINPTTFTIPVSFTTAGGTNGITFTYQTPVNYPWKDQIGSGEDVGGTPYTGGATDPMYVWHNLAAASTNAGTATVPWVTVWKSADPGAETLYASQGGTAFGQADIIKPDRDFFTDLTVTDTLTGLGTNSPGWNPIGGNPTFNGSTGIGRGTTAQMNAITPTKVGVGFWCTDQGTWNSSGDSYGNGELYVWNGTAWVLRYVPYAYPHPMRLPLAPTNVSISSP